MITMITIGMPLLFLSFFSILCLRKSHKVTFRTIVSSIGTYNCKFGNFLTDILDPVIPKDHYAKDSFSFCKEIWSFPYIFGSRD